MTEPGMDQAIASFRAFNRVHTRFAGVLTPRYMGSELSLVEARLLYEIATRESVLRGLQGGADGYITKPFVPDVLVTAVKAVLGLLPPPEPKNKN